MGVDFIRTRAKAFQKRWDQDRKELATPSLFSPDVDCAERTVAADIVSGVTLQKGDLLLVQQSDDDLVALRGLSTVARFKDIPATLLEAVREGCGVATGTVERVHEIAGVAEISLC